jgi:hypothetical protein
MQNSLVLTGQIFQIVDFVAFGRLIYKKQLLNPKPNTDNEVETLVNQLTKEEDATVVKAAAANAQLVDQEVDQDKDGVLIEYASETMVDTAPLACNKWSIKSIDCRYLTHQIAPTVAGHAQEVA